MPLGPKNLTKKAIEQADKQAGERFIVADRKVVEERKANGGVLPSLASQTVFFSY